MATSNYTTNLHLSAWTENDRPKRADFVSDNQIIDTQLGGHLANMTMHLTADEKAKIGEAFICASYVGTGEASRTITLAFRPKMVFVFKRGVPFTVYSGSVNNVNAACCFYGNGSSVGISITTSGVIVGQSQSAENGIKVCLNESGAQYSIIAFK